LLVWCFGFLRFCAHFQHWSATRAAKHAHTRCWPHPPPPHHYHRGTKCLFGLQRRGAKYHTILPDMPALHVDPAAGRRACRTCDVTFIEPPNMWPGIARTKTVGHAVWGAFQQWRRPILLATTQSSSSSAYTLATVHWPAPSMDGDARWSADTCIEHLMWMKQ